MSDKLVKIKIFEIKGNNCYECGGDQYAIGVSDWQEVTEDEYNFLVKHINSLRHAEADYQIVRECDVNETQQFITDIRQYIADVAEKQKAERLKKEQQKIDRALKKAKDDEAKIKLYQQLQRELGEV